MLIFENMYSKNYWHIIIALFWTSILWGQNTFQPKSVNLEYKGIIYRTERSIDLRLHTNGAAIAYNTGRIDAFNKTSYYHIELGYLKDFRERKQSRNFNNNGLISTRSFILGKRNNLLVLRAGKGWKRYLSEKARRKGIAVGYSYEVGPSLALLKPYYLNVVNSTIVDGELVNTIEEVKYSEENREVFLDRNRIQGASGYWKGFDEISVVPGIQAKGGLLFSLGAYDKMVKAVEVGAMVDFYIKKVPIMVESESVSNKPYFFNLYLSLQLGTRSN